MNNKGALGSLIAGVIAVFLVLVCAFYLSFTIVGNHYDDLAEEYALQKAGKEGPNSDAFKQAYKSYIDSISNEKVYMGYTYNDVQKWGVGLGLDLKGGMNVILQVSMPDMLRSMKNSGEDEIFDRALASTDSIININKNGDYISTFINKYRELNPGGDFSVVFPDVVKAEQGANVEATISALKSEVRDRVDNSATNVLRNRIDAFGVVSPNIQVLQGKDGQILLELPGVKEHDRVRDLLQRSANLEFYETYAGNDIASNIVEFRRKFADSPVFTDSLLQFTAGDASPNIGIARGRGKAKIDSLLTSEAAKQILPSNLKILWEVKPIEGENGKPTDFYRLIALKTNNGKPALDGSAVANASSDLNSTRGDIEVSMSMTDEGARAWSRITNANLGKPVAIVLDDKVYSYPRVNNAINDGRSSITGNFTPEEGQDLANVLKSGKMNAKVNIISDMVIGPSLGEQAIQAGFISFILALVLLMIFMGVIYGFIPGLVADLGLVFNLFFTFGILASFQAVLTLSGIAGIVLALGMAVDANVLIFERTKEELRAGKNVRNAIADGYSNAFSAIFDSNLTSIITGIILLLYGTGPIKGFATTLIIGIACSFFTAVYLTRIVFIWFGNTKVFKNLTFTTKISKNFLLNTKINFLGQRKWSFLIALVLIVGIVFSFIFRGLNQGIDFSGGRNYVVKLDAKKAVSPLQIQEVLAPEFPGASLSVINIEGEDQVRISTNYKINDDDPNVEQEITGKLYNALLPYVADGMTPEHFSTTDENQGIMSSQKVGPTVAEDMKRDAWIAVGISLVAMFLYILLRFRNVAFSVGALAAVAFTAYVIIGFYSVCWGNLPFTMEIDQSFIAAVLTVIGYQINDTVVVFDRVRENINLYPKLDFFTLVNRSINSTLSRTLITSGSTALVLACIFFLGGDSLRSFVFAMLLGVFVGTLATIYIAAPIAYLTDKGRANRKAKKLMRVQAVAVKKEKKSSRTQPKEK